MLVWNALAARTPALVVQPVSARDVAVAVGFARDLGLLLSVKAVGTTSPARPSPTGV